MAIDKVVVLPQSDGVNEVTEAAALAIKQNVELRKAVDVDESGQTVEQPHAEDVENRLEVPRALGLGPGALVSKKMQGELVRPPVGLLRNPPFVLQAGPRTPS